MKLILARDKGQFDRYRFQQGLSLREAHYAASPDSTRGMTLAEDDVVVLSGFFNRPDAYEIWLGARFAVRASDVL